MFYKLLTTGLIGALLGGATSVEAQIAQAAVLEDITIDGDLSDWPEDLRRYPMRTKVITDDTGLEGADLDDSGDLSPEFRVGYDPSKNMVYVAVEVRDDHVVIGNNYDQTDGVEIYIQGDDDWPMQYAYVPGAGGSYNRGGPNPHLYQGDIYQTRTEVAHSRRGDTIVYEWAIEGFEDYPDGPLALAAGQRLLFDVVAVDKDPDEQGYGFIAWGPSNSDKYNGAGRVGRLELTGDVVSVGPWWMNPGLRGLLTDVVDALMAVVIILAIGLAVGLVLFLARRPKKGDVAPDVLESMVMRLEAIEQRLTDTQDVMIDLSEKYDRLEGKYQSSSE